MNFLQILFLAFLTITLTHSATKEEWKTRAIYQILTDRFHNPQQKNCPNLLEYCGGTWSGITQQLDYISNLGFNAIWISPVVQQIGEGSYHGYWSNDLYSLNESFGTKGELKSLIEECHKRDIYVMLDVVANHMGPIQSSFQQLAIFNQKEYFHDYCVITQDDYNGANQSKVEDCRLAGLPDLKQEHPFVSDTLLKWISYMVKEYSLDGLRIDTVAEVPKWFWKAFSQSAKVFSTGEVLSGLLPYIADYQNSLPSLLHYPLYFSAIQVFAHQQNMSIVTQTLQLSSQAFQDSSVLAVFSDNHDQPRFLHMQSDISLFKNYLLFNLAVPGIPVLYYGSEQQYSGSQDPNNREVLWPNYDTNSELYLFIAKINQIRQQSKYQLESYVERYLDDQFLAFSRGMIMFLVTNRTRDQVKQENKWYQIQYHPYQNGDKLCSAFDQSVWYEVKSDGFWVNLVKNSPDLLVKC